MQLEDKHVMMMPNIMVASFTTNITQYTMSFHVF